MFAETVSKVRQFLASLDLATIFLFLCSARIIGIHHISPSLRTLCSFNSIVPKACGAEGMHPHAFRSCCCECVI